MDKVAAFCVFTPFGAVKNKNCHFFGWYLRLTEQSDGSFSPDKVAPLLPKPVYIICKCNQMVQLHVSRCRSGKQPSCKMGLLRIISPSTAPIEGLKVGTRVTMVVREMTEPRGQN